MSESNAGEMRFALGLTTGIFLGPLANAGGAAKTFRVSLLGMGDAVKQVFGQIEKGAGLEHLSKRTGESVGDIYALQKAFKAVGLDAGSVSQVIYQMNRALGGFNEMGEPTKDIFAGLGLSVEKLKSMRAQDALTAIFGSLSKLNNAEATNAASKIFGRGGAADALQAARSMETFRDALAGAAPLAALFAQIAPAFGAISRAIDKFQNRTGGFFAEIAAGAAPGIQKVLDFLNQIDLTGFGHKIGTVIRVAFSEGNFEGVLFLSLAAGFERAFSFASSLFADLALWDGMKDSFLAASTASNGMLSGFLHRFVVIGHMAKDALSADWNKLYGDAGATTREQQDKVQKDYFLKSFQTWDQYAKQVDQKIRENGGFDMASHVMNAGKAVGLALKNARDQPAGPAEEELMDLIKNNPILKSLVERKPGGASILGEGLPGKSPRHHEDVDALTRIGFFRGGNSQLNDYARDTARNTRDLLQAVKVSNELLMKLQVGVPSFFNL